MSHLATLGALFAICAVALAATCGSQPDRSTPAGTAQRLYEAIADWDTSEIVDLACPQIRDEVESGLSLGSVLFGLGGVLGLGVPSGKLRDMSYTVASETTSDATVIVNGRILYGAPYGSMSIDDQPVVLAKDGGRWCVADDGAL